MPRQDAIGKYRRVARPLGPPGRMCERAHRTAAKMTRPTGTLNLVRRATRYWAGGEITLPGWMLALKREKMRMRPTLPPPPPPAPPPPGEALAPCPPLVLPA